jgi:exonuclease VII small subunit
MDGNHNFWDGDTICLGPPTAHQYNEFHDMLAHYLGRIVTELERGSDPLSEALRR